jgi:glycosyltransferase involved in cell wall biosynthesis
MASRPYRPVAEGEHTGSLAVLAPRRERLALISTSSRLCGVAAYTAALERHLADVFDVTVFDLDQYMLRNGHKRVRKLADRHIKEICAAITEFDAVNLQLEYGMLGVHTADICRRFSWLAEASPHFSVTFHTLRRPTAFPRVDFAKAVLTGRWRTAGDIHAAYRRNSQLSLGIARRLRKAMRQKPISIIVHNRRDRREIEQVHGFECVFDHPLAFLAPAEAHAAIIQAKRRRFPLLDRLTSDDVLIGVFGFLNDYKGFETTVRALYHLPKTHHLLIFGGIHPNEIAPNRSIHPYLLSLLGEAHVDATPEPRGRRSEIEITAQAGPHPRDLSARVHFMGALDDADFLAGMAICDVVVFPYLEVGQSASGPMSQAVELGRRIIATRTHTFIEFAEYHPDVIEFFEIGNHLELANRILARPQFAGRRGRPRYNVETNKAVYFAANSAEPPTAPRFRRHPPIASPADRQAGDCD